MRRKAILSLCLAMSMLMSGIVPVFAEEEPVIAEEELLLEADAEVETEEVQI